MRVDPSHHFLGERLNFWVSLIVFLVASVAFVWLQFSARPAGAGRRCAATRAARDGRPGARPPATLG